MSTNRVEVQLLADITNLQRGMQQATQVVRNFHQAVSQPINIPAPTIPTLNTAPLQQGLQQANTHVRNFGNGVSRAGQTMQNAFAPAAAASAFALGRMIQNSRDFESQTRRAAVLTGGSYDQVKSSILDMASTSVYSTGEVAAAFAEMGAKGFDAAQATDALPGVLSAAAASGEDLGLVADTITSALNSFGMEASKSGHVADVLAQAANQSAAGVLDLQYAFKYASGPAAQLGISMEELAASVGIMADNGIKGETAGTALRASLLRLVKPPKAAANMLKELGVAVTDQQGNMKPLSDIIGQLKTGMEGMTKAQKGAALATIFGVEAVSGMMALVSAGPDEINKMTKALENSGGASKKAAKDMQEGWAGALKMMESALDTAGRAFTDSLAPAITAVANKIGWLATAFKDLPSSVQTIIATVAAVATAFLIFGTVAGIAMSAIGTFVSVIGGLAASLFGAVGGMSGLSAVFAAITGPIGIVIAAIAGLGVALVAMWQSNEQFRNSVMTAWTAIQEVISTVISAVSSFIMSVWGQVVAFWNENQTSILTAARNVWTMIQTVINTALTVIMAIFQAVWPVLQLIVQGVWENIKGVIQGALTVIQGIIQLFSGIFSGDFGLMWEGIKNIFFGAIQVIWNWFNLMLVGRLLSLGKLLFAGLKGIVVGGWSFIKSAFQGSISSISTLVSNGFTSIKTIISFVMNTVKSIVSGAWNAIKSGTSSVMSAIRSVISSVWNAIKSIISTVVNSAKAVVQVAFQSMKNVVSEISSSISSTISSAWNGIISFLRGINLMSIGKNIMDGLLKGITSMASSIWNKVTEIGNGIKDKLTGLFKIHSPSRWMRDMIGVNMVQGWINGIDGMKGAVLRTADNMTNWMKPEMLAVDTGYANTSLAKAVSPSAYSNKERSSGDVSAQSSSRPLTIENVMVMDGYEVARATVDHLDGMQADRLSIKSYMRGR
ncbi:phage tail tape measure protein [Bacillus sp. DX4.1]|uniref:phage tail tape measure protein n=1 Tax=Bacillus sp. DX4.1 TaxID=3055867 RepID=UPI0025A19961|nr:phage tail tape measure protein [Bacillus sp. DX4.1]MDM5187870.1 phage tail tape measure protein [Bacillus sp. DX4.1]